MFSRSKRRRGNKLSSVKKPAVITIIKPEQEKIEEPFDLSTAKISIIKAGNSGLMINVKENIEGEEDE